MAQQFDKGIMGNLICGFPSKFYNFELTLRGEDSNFSTPSFCIRKGCYLMFLNYLLF